MEIFIWAFMVLFSLACFTGLFSSSMHSEFWRGFGLLMVLFAGSLWNLFVSIQKRLHPNRR